MSTFALKMAQKAQSFLESEYNLKSDIDIRDFINISNSVPSHGALHFKEAGEDIELSVVLDRDYFSASQNLNSHQCSVIFEEVSHFVYICHNHSRNKNISSFELELQSEVDRILATRLLQNATLSRHFCNKLFYEPYHDQLRDRARHVAKSFLKKLSTTNPLKWSQKDLASIYSFYHSDLYTKHQKAKAY